MLPVGTAVHEEQFTFGDLDQELLGALRDLLWRAVRSQKVEPLQLGALGRALDALGRLPEPTPALDVYVSFGGPGATTGTRTNTRFWSIRLTSEEIYIDTGGNSYDPSVGGDNFTCLQWWCAVGSETSWEDYTHHHDHIVAGLRPPLDEIRNLDPDAEGVEISVEDNSEEAE